VPIFDPDSLKIRPIDTEFNAPPEVQHYNLEGQYYIQAERVFDGPVFGVLNLDAGWDYNRVKLPEDPEGWLDDPRIDCIVAFVQREALHIGKLFSEAFRFRGDQDQQDATD